MLPQQIQELIALAKQQRGVPGVNKQWLNKTIARLEEAEIFSSRVFSGRVLGIPTPDGSQVNPEVLNRSKGPVRGCTCPEGAVDTTCSAHGNAV